MPPSMRWSSVIPSLPVWRTQICPSALSSRAFSATPRNDRYRLTRQRRVMFRWLETRGAAFREPLPGSTNYLSAYNRDGNLQRTGMPVVGHAPPKPRRWASNDPADAQENLRTAASSDTTPETAYPPENLKDLRPFPANTHFISDSVLSEKSRELIWRLVMQEGKSVREVSAFTGVTMNRVGAVVRLKEIEKEWLADDIPLAKPYAQAVSCMIPQFNVPRDGEPAWKRKKQFEPLNGLSVHDATTVQIFHPTSESRVFTREDAAKVFAEDLLPADQRIPHPEIVECAKDELAHMSQIEVEARAKERDDKEIEARQKYQIRKAQRQAAVKKVDTPRWEFRFEEIKVDDAGTDGRGPRGVGWRYGVPHMDRSKGMVKIPTRVE